MQKINLCLVPNTFWMFVNKADDIIANDNF